MQERMSAAQFRERKPSSGKKKARFGKFNAKRVETEDGKFDSTQEYKRFLELKMLLRAGEIQNLERQVPFPLVSGGIHISTYVADFVYEVKGQRVVEDSKGFVTPEYRQKRRLMREIHGIEILETGIKKRATKAKSWEKALESRIGDL